MPLTKIKCPHCEAWNEVPVASVTRSRVCPGCGKPVLFRVSENRTTREALLVDREEVSEEGGFSLVELPYLPKALTKGDIDRQRKDPESRLLLLKLAIGGVLLLLLCLVLFLAEGTRYAEVSSDWEGEEPSARAVVQVEKRAEVVGVDVAKGTGGKPAVVRPEPAGERAGAFGALMRERPSRPVLLRVWATTGQQFGGVFGDSDWLRCVELRAAEDPEGAVIHAYVAKTSDAGRAVDFRLRQGGGERQQWTVRVRYPAGAEEPNQVWLDELVADTWDLDGIK